MTTKDLRCSEPARRDDLQQPLDGYLADVEQLTHQVLDQVAVDWPAVGHCGGALGGSSVPELLRRQVAAGGKRLRPLMAFWGWVYAHGRPGAQPHSLVQLGSALELLHVFSLVQDDVMDRSAQRRGVPTTHTVVAGAHRRAGALGSSRQFGDSIAVLVGDLSHALAEQLVAGLPAAVRSVWRLTTLDLVAGQVSDLVGAADRRRDMAHARAVARLKSGAYTVTRPLELGATLGGAGEAKLTVLRQYGAHLGEAFALRDDLLGVWGRPETTGKPVGEDLLDGKATVLLAMADQRLRGPARRLLDQLTEQGLSPEQVPQLQRALEDAGIRAEVEAMIAAQVEDAVGALDAAGSGSIDGIHGLRRMADRIAWRQT